MKKTINLVILFIFMTLPSMTVASVEGNHSLSIEDVLLEIKTAQQVSSDKDIDCDKVADKEFEKMGEAFMGLRHTDEDEHEQMDTMMGGEGSNTLVAMHIIMGKNYLGCSSGMMNAGMMGGGMMGFDNNSSLNFNNKNNSMMNMMGNFGYFGFSWIFMILFWTLIVVVIIVAIKWLINQNKNESKTALDILKERYAKGEIGKKEFEEKKNEIKS